MTHVRADGGATVSEMRYDGRVAVVTGAGRGLGRAHALLLAQRGAKVVVCDAGVELDGSGQSAGPATTVVDEISAVGGRAIAYTADLTAEDGAIGAVELAIREFGRIDVVIHNACIPPAPAPAEEYPEERLAYQLDIVLWAGLRMARAALPSMKAQRYGRFVFTTSNAIYGTANMLGYAAAKLAVLGLMRSLALEAVDAGIRANALAPFAYTRMVTSTATPEFRDWLEHVGTVGRVAPVAAYLAHEDCSLNGEVLLAGGGRVARIFLGETSGYVNPDLTPEAIREHLGEVLAVEGFEIPNSLDDSVMILARALGGVQADLEVVAPAGNRP